MITPHEARKVRNEALGLPECLEMIERAIREAAIAGECRVAIQIPRKITQAIADALQFAGWGTGLVRPIPKCADKMLLEVEW